MLKRHKWRLQVLTFRRFSLIGRSSNNARFRVSFSLTRRSAFIKNTPSRTAQFTIY